MTHRCTIDELGRDDVVLRRHRMTITREDLVLLDHFMERRSSGWPGRLVDDRNGRSFQLIEPTPPGCSPPRRRSPIEDDATAPTVTHRDIQAFAVMIGYDWSPGGGFARDEAMPAVAGRERMDRPDALSLSAWTRGLPLIDDPEWRRRLMTVLAPLEEELAAWNAIAFKVAHGPGWARGRTDRTPAAPADAVTRGVLDIIALLKDMPWATPHLAARAGNHQAAVTRDARRDWAGTIVAGACVELATALGAMRDAVGNGSWASVRRKGSPHLQPATRGKDQNVFDLVVGKIEQALDMERAGVVAAEASAIAMA